MPNSFFQLFSYQIASIHFDSTSRPKSNLKLKEFKEGNMKFIKITETIALGIAA